VQIAAVSEDQTDNTYSVIYELLTANDGRAADELSIDVGLTRCYLRDRPGKLEPVTASAGSREGQPITDATLDETHLWTPTNGGVAGADAAPERGEDGRPHLRDDELVRPGRGFGGRGHPQGLPGGAGHLLRRGGGAAGEAGGLRRGPEGGA
jgi:hypothetical protein